MNFWGGCIIVYDLKGTKYFSRETFFHVSEKKLPKMATGEAREGGREGRILNLRARTEKRNGAVLGDKTRLPLKKN